MPPVTCPRAILFDWDNTLVDAWPGITTALNAALTAFGHAPWTITQVRERVRRSLRDTFPAMFGAAWTDARDVFYRALADSHLQTVQPLEGATASIEAAFAAGIPLGVVSNKAGAFLRREVEALGWKARFGGIVGAGDAEADKPDAAPIRLALLQMGQGAGMDVWYVGDTALDMQAARASGCLAVLIGDASHDGGVANAAPDFHCTDHIALQHTLATLLRGDAVIG